MNEGINIKFKDLPEITQTELKTNNLKYIEGRAFGDYIIYLCFDKFRDVNCNLITKGDKLFGNQDKKTPTKYNIGNLKQAIRLASVDWARKYRKILYGSECYEKIALYHRYAKYFVKKYNHGYVTDIKVHPFYKVHYFVGVHN